MDILKNVGTTVKGLGISDFMKMALYEMYRDVRNGIEDGVETENQRIQLTGAIRFLESAGALREDQAENLWMLSNQLETQANKQEETNVWELKAELEKARAELRKAKEELEKAMAELEKAKIRMEEMGEMLDAKVEYTGALSKMYEDLQEKHGELTLKYEDTRRRHTELIGRIMELMEKLNH